MGVKNIPEGFHTLNPTLIVQGAKEAVEFYKKAFGAKEKRIFYGEDKIQVVHAELEIGDSVLMLSDEYPSMHVLGPKSPGGGTSASIYMFVDNVDEVFHNAVSAGAIVTMPLEDSFWGDRSASITDPFGHRWMLATHKKDLSNEEIQKASEEMFKKREQ